MESELKKCPLCNQPIQMKLGKNYHIGKNITVFEIDSHNHKCPALIVTGGHLESNKEFYENLSRVAKARKIFIFTASQRS